MNHMKSLHKRNIITKTITTPTTNSLTLALEVQIDFENSNHEAPMMVLGHLPIISLNLITFAYGIYLRQTLVCCNLMSFGNRNHFINSML